MRSEIVLLLILLEEKMICSYRCGGVVWRLRKEKKKLILTSCGRMCPRRVGIFNAVFFIQKV